MAAAESSPAANQKSPLYKPLAELTEDDIAQVTREDCRRFLKEKGMRRPSWNKSQAIQQVISLKALLEPKPESDGTVKDVASSSGTARNPSLSMFASQQPQKHSDQPSSLRLELPPKVPDQPSPPAVQLQFCSVALPPAAAVTISVDVSTVRPEEEAPYRSSDAVPPLQEVADVSPRVGAGTSAGSVVGQMTVFYDGKINVFDGVPSDKARAIMRIAASRHCYSSSSNPPIDLNWPAHHPHPYLVQANAPPRPPPLAPMARSGAVPAVRLPRYLREGMDRRSLHESETDAPICRKASLQRYLEKRKDRRTLKCKRNIEGLSSSSIDMYLAQKFRSQNPSGRQCQSDTSSPHPKPPRTPNRCNSTENETQHVQFSFDLNDDDVQEI